MQRVLEATRSTAAPAQDAEHMPTCEAVCTLSNKAFALLSLLHPLRASSQQAFVNLVGLEEIDF